MMRKTGFLVMMLAVCVSLTGLALAQDSVDTASACAGLPTHSQLQAALGAAQATSNGGFGLQMWGTIVNRDGVVCAVAFTGTNRGSQWPGSRVISAQKANTANAFSLTGLALSTANLYSAVNPGGSLYGLQASRVCNVVDDVVRSFCIATHSGGNIVQYQRIPGAPCYVMVRAGRVSTDAKRA